MDEVEVIEINHFLVNTSELVNTEDDDDDDYNVSDHHTNEVNFKGGDSSKSNESIHRIR